MANNKWIWWAVGIAAVLGILFYIPRIGKKAISTDVPCLIANTPLLQHIHPALKIIIDGTQKPIPANIGLASCERALHTHDDTGTFHVEAQDKREYTLGDFFSVWGEQIEKSGYALAMTVDGRQSTALGKLLLKEKQEIILTYTKK